MKGKKKSLVLTAVILATVMLATTIALAEPPFPEAPVKIEHEVKESTMELYYVCSGSSRHAFATEAELCNFLGVDYMTPRPLELYYVSPIDGIRFATEAELIAHMNGVN